MLADSYMASVGEKVITKHSARVAVAAAALALTALVSPAPAGARPARFLVGAAAADLTPPPGVAVYSGGFGLSPPLHADNVDPRDPLQVRAIFVSDGHRAVEIAIVDSQGLFEAVQEGAGLGTTGIRDDAAREIDSRYGRQILKPAAIIVQASHSHSAPTAMGIWGPVADAYLHELHDRTVTALVTAAANARPAHLQWSSLDAPYLDNINTNQTDSYEGWVQDGQLSALRALDPATGATIATLVNVPAHPDIVDGAGLKVLTDDYLGAVRARLDDELGGISIVGPATLGREESPVQVDGVAAMRWYAGAVAELATRALGSARWIEDGQVGGTEQLIEAPGHNALLLALLAAWQLPEAQRQQIADQTGTYPINRSLLPPYLIGNTIGSYVTALRIGPLAYVTLNGEEFPEVRHAIAAAAPGTAMVVGLGLGQDQLGYMFPPFVYPFANGVFPYPSDHLFYNISATLADELTNAQTLNLRQLGFATAPLAIPRPENNDYQQGFHPGLQALASPARGDAGPTGTFTTAVEGIFEGNAIPGNLGFGLQPRPAGQIQWLLGDGSRHDSGDNERFNHAYRPGRYEVTLAASDASGDQAHWQLEIIVYPQLSAGYSQASLGGQSFSFTGRASGGDGVVLAWRWTFSDGSTADGQRVVHTFPAGIAPTATLTVTDSTGTTASASSPS
jgi:hypothetical protein